MEWGEWRSKGRLLRSHTPRTSLFIRTASLFALQHWLTLSKARKISHPAVVSFFSPDTRLYIWRMLIYHGSREKATARLGDGGFRSQPEKLRAFAKSPLELEILRLLRPGVSLFGEVRPVNRTRTFRNQAFPPGQFSKRDCLIRQIRTAWSPRMCCS